MLNRRKFIKGSTAITTLLATGISPLKASENKLKKITILHTNDMHSRIEPFSAKHRKYAGMGGFAARAKLIQKIRREEKNVLLLDAGDIFQGTPYFNFFGGELEFKLMSKLKYDVATLGNHDFDNGLDGFHKQLKHADFNFVNANYDFKNTILDGKIKPFKILKKDGIKIGIFGIGIQLEGLVSKNLYKETSYQDPIGIAQDYSRILKEEYHCDLIICLSHLGYDYKSDKISDLKLASKTENIDLIIGGHTHTLLAEPSSVKNRVGKNVLVNQVGWAGLYLGKINFELNTLTNEKLAINNSTMPINLG